MRKTAVSVAAAAGCAIWLVACSSTTELTEEGRHVRLLTGRVPDSCTALDEVDANPYLPSSRPEINLRNNAGEIGANAVIVTRAFRFGGGMRYQGIAYECPEILLPEQ